MTLADGAEGAHVRAHRRDRGRGDDVASRADRRRAELGLPLLLAPRRDLRARRARRQRLHRRGAGMAEVAAACRRGRPGRPADHVRAGRRAAARRAGARLARRVRGLDAGADRQRRQPPVPARRLRRGARPPAPGAPPATRAGRGLVGAPAEAAPEPRAAVARARRGDLGGARARAATSRTPR